MGEKIDRIRKKLRIQGRAERNAGPELSDIAQSDARKTQSQYAQWDETFDRFDPTGERARAKEFIQSINFDILEEILFEDIYKSAGPNEKKSFRRLPDPLRVKENRGG